MRPSPRSKRRFHPRDSDFAPGFLFELCDGPPWAPFVPECDLLRFAAREAEIAPRLAGYNLAFFKTLMGESWFEAVLAPGHFPDDAGFSLFRHPVCE